MHTLCVGCHEASLFLTLITPLSALFEEPCILPVSGNSRCLWLLSSASLLRCWANGRVSAVGRQQQCSQGLAVATCGTAASSHNPEKCTSSRLGFHLFTLCGGECCCSLNLKCSLCVWAWRTQQPFLSKTRYGHNWPMHWVSCWKSRFCCDVRAVAPV